MISFNANGGGGPPREASKSRETTARLHAFESKVLTALQNQISAFRKVVPLAEQHEWVDRYERVLFTQSRRPIMLRPGHATSRYSSSNLCLLNLWPHSHCDDMQFLRLPLVCTAMRETPITQCTPSYSGTGVTNTITVRNINNSVHWNKHENLSCVRFLRTSLCLSSRQFLLSNQTGML